MGGSFAGLDRLLLPYNILILEEVYQREDNGNLDITFVAKDGPEEKSGPITFKLNDRSKKDYLSKWLKSKIGTDIETLYNSEFNF